MAIMWNAPIEPATGMTPAEIAWRMWIIEALTRGSAEAVSELGVAVSGAAAGSDPGEEVPPTVDAA